MSQTIPHRALAERYAAALFDLADSKKQLDTVSKELLSVQALLDESDALRALIRSPLVGRAAQARAMDAVLQKAGLSELVRNFVGLVAAKARLFALPSMIRVFQDELARRRGELRAEVTVATALSDSQAEALREALTQAYGKKLDIQTQVDPSLLGGLKVRVGSRLVDASLATQVSKLKLAMSRGLTGKGAV